MSSNGSTRLTHGLVDIHDAMDEVRRMGELQSEETSSFIDGLPPELRNGIKALFDTIHSIQEAVSHFLKNLFPEMNLGEGTDPTVIQGLVHYLTLGFLVILAGFISYFLLRQLKKLWTQREPRPKPVILREVDGSLLASARSHMKSAQAFADKGQYEEGVRQLYLAMLCLLDETHLVPFEANRTNWEYLRRIQTLSPDTPQSEGFQENLKQWFTVVAQTFERTRYGHKPVDLACYKACWEKIDSLFSTLKPIVSKQEAQKS